jgi:GT2 family glycosyltransferase
MNVSVGYTIYNKKNLISSIVGSLGWLDDDDELIFLFDSCTDGSLEELLRLQKYLPINSEIIVPDDELFEIKANNEILKRATKDVVILFQDDMICKDFDFKEKVSRVISSYKPSELGLMGARSGYELDGTPNFPPVCRYNVSNWEHKLEQVGEKLKDGEFKERTVLNRGPIVFTKNLINDVGYLNEDLFPLWGDDVDYCCRAVSKGRKNVVFESEIYSPLEWGTMRTKNKTYPLGDGSIATSGTVMRRNWKYLYEKWGNLLKEKYEDFTIKQCQTL